MANSLWPIKKQCLQRCYCCSRVEVFLKVYFLIGIFLYILLIIWKASPWYQAFDQTILIAHSSDAEKIDLGLPKTVSISTIRGFFSIKILTTFGYIWNLSKNDRFLDSISAALKRIGLAEASIIITRRRFIKIKYFILWCDLGTVLGFINTLTLAHWSVWLLFIRLILQFVRIDMSSIIDVILVMRCSPRCYFDALSKHRTCSIRFWWRLTKRMISKKWYLISLFMTDGLCKIVYQSSTHYIAGCVEKWTPDPKKMKHFIFFAPICFLLIQRNVYRTNGLRSIWYLEPTFNSPF